MARSETIDALVDALKRDPSASPMRPNKPASKAAKGSASVIHHFFSSRPRSGAGPQVRGRLPGRPRLSFPRPAGPARGRGREKAGV